MCHLVTFWLLVFLKKVEKHCSNPCYLKLYSKITFKDVSDNSDYIEKLLRSQDEIMMISSAFCL